MFAFLVGSGAVLAQDTSASSTQSADPAPQAETNAAATDPQLLNTEIGTEVLAYLLIPLTREQLATLAKEWLAIIQKETQAISDKQVELVEDPRKATDEAYKEIALLIEKRAFAFVRFSMILDDLERKDGDKDLIAELRAYRDSVLYSEAVMASPKAIAIAAFTWLTRSDGGGAVAKDIGVIIAAFVALIFVSRFIRVLVGRWMGRTSKLSKLLRTFVIEAVYWLVFALGLLFVLTALGVNVTPMFAMIGGASFVLAFAFQDTLGNLASGLMIMINRPFDEGDYVEVSGIGGTVKSVSIVTTTVITPDNQLIVIPNKNVWGNVITNVTARDTRRVDLIFGISYDDSIPDAMKVMDETVKAHPLVLKDPAPVIRVHELGDSSVNFICRPWARTEDYWTVYWDLTHSMKEALEGAGLSIPYPQTDVHVRTQTS